MKTIVCAIRDSAMQAFATPMFFPSRGVAVRAFTGEVNRADDKNQLYTNSADFELHVLAEYVEETGQFVPSPDNGCICRAADVLNRE